MSLLHRLKVLGCLAFGIGCKEVALGTAPRTLAERTIVFREADGTYRLQFDRPEARRIYAGDSPAAIDWHKPIYEGADTELRLTDWPVTVRKFFGIIEADGRRHIVSERLLPLRGALNVRDLGGLPAAGGKMTRWGLLYRAGHLAGLTRSDLDYLRGIGLRTVVDFRSDAEIKKHPNSYLKKLSVDYRQVPIGDKEGNVQRALKRQIFSADPEAFDSRAFVADLNRQFVDQLAHQYAPFFALLGQPRRAPILWYCAAGKDRTGFATAIVLDALGVARARIMDDFLMSNYYRHAKNERNLRKAILAGVDRRIAEPLLVVDASYLQHAFDEIDRKFGSTPAFLAAELGVDAAALQRLRATYLVDVSEE